MTRNILAQVAFPGRRPHPQGFLFCALQVGGSPWPRLGRMALVDGEVANEGPVSEGRVIFKESVHRPASAARAECDLALSPDGVSPGAVSSP